MPVARGHLFFWVFLAVSSHSLWAQLSGPSLVYSTYLSGSAPGTAPPPIATEATAIAVDASGNAYVTGQTESSTFPVTTTIPAGLVPSFANPCVFVTKLSPQGALANSTLLGGALQQVANGIAVDSAGNAYITGHTSSSDFPTVNALQAVNRSGQTAFVAKLNATGTALVYSTYLGGSTVDPNYGDIGLAIGVDAAGNAYVAGATSEADFPTVNGIPASGSSNLRFHGFLSKLNTAGSALIYSTFLGSGPNESVKANSLAVDAAGNAYVGGQTIAGFPTANPIQANYQGGPSDGFVLKMDLGRAGLLHLSGWQSDRCRECHLG